MDETRSFVEFEKELFCEKIQIEGIEAVETRPIFNWIRCNYFEECDWKKDIRKGEERRGACRYNPAMFRCLAYQFLEKYFRKPFI